MSFVGNITGFQHLGVPVSNLEASIRFYERLGFRIEDRSELEESGGVTKVAFMEMSGFCIELYQPPEGVPATRNVGPIDHFAFDVRDIDEAFKELSEAGFSMIEEAPVALPLRAKGVKYFMVCGPDGERVEFNEIV